jgi:hypothetical protein
VTLALGLATRGDVPEAVLQVPNEAAQLMAGPLFRRDVLCFEGGIGGDVLRHIFGPNDFFRKQIKAERGKEEKVKRKIMWERGSKSRENSPSNRAFLWRAALLGLLAFVHGFGVFSSGDSGGNEK